MEHSEAKSKNVIKWPIIFRFWKNRVNGDHFKHYRCTSVTLAVHDTYIHSCLLDFKTKAIDGVPLITSCVIVVE